MKRTAKNLRLILIAMGMVATPLGSVRAQEKEAVKENYVKTHYTKYEYRIPMRDGKKLFTSLYVPKDSSQTYPFLMQRTPYNVGPYGPEDYKKTLGPSDEFEKSGYIFVYQDVRGRYMSEGDFLEMRPHLDAKKSAQDTDDSTDTYDTIEFLLKNVANNNGNVGIYGISYPGFYTSASIIDSHPALKAASPQAPMTDLFLGDDAYHGGAFMLSANFGFYDYFRYFPKPSPPVAQVESDFGTPDGYAFYLNAGPTENLKKAFPHGDNPLFNDQLTHDTYDSYWKVRDLSQHMKNVKCAVLVVGGWYDAEDLSGPFKTSQAIAKFNAGTPNTLVEGPWVHGGWARGMGDHLGDVQFASATSEFFRAHIQFPFFEHYLKSKEDPKLPKAYVFETGTNVWRKYDAWPPTNTATRTLYFHAGGKLSFAAPADQEGFDEYLSDPAHPVPFVNYTAASVPQRYMVDDQRFAAERPDVLTYVSEPLEEDLTIAGPISPKLKVASTGTDSDFDVKLIDVYPDNSPDNHDPAKLGKRVLDAPEVKMGGYQQLLRGEPMRAKFRNGWEKPEPLIPGKQAEVDFSMPDLNHTFRRGHRIMVQVQSTWFPLTDRNPQTFVDIPQAKPEDFKKATEQVFHEKGAASGVQVLVLTK
ncbi:MAG TPA: CocE/NonD family hydrolase [Candidatus Saccharimonadales bacterium]|nr:CocE/NonD family hydrolase [Candidatus Saccharimonadales bacterium]